MKSAFATLVVCTAARLARADEPAVPEPVPVEPAPPAPPPAEPAPIATAIAAPAPSPAPSDVAPPRFAPWPTARLVFEVEVYTQGRLARRAGDDLNELRLDRGELGGRVRLGTHGFAELRGETIRSAVEGGSLGIDGDSTVIRAKLAQVGGWYDVGPVRLEGSMGFVPDPWIRHLEDDFTIKPLTRTASERLLGWAPVDLAGQLRAELGPVRATVAIQNGEGQRFPERNTGKTTTALVEVVPLHTRALHLNVAGVVRDGSIGVASIRDRRFGGAVTAVTPWARASAEVVRALGIGDRPELEGLLVGGWLDVHALDRLSIAGRAASLDYSGDGRLSMVGAALAVEPWREPGDRPRARLRLWLAVDRITTSGVAMPLPGADTGQQTLVMLVASATAPFTLE